MDGTAPDLRETWVIEPKAEGIRARAVDVWHYRRLLAFFARKAFQKLYRRTVLGWVWIFIRPLFPIVVNTFVFGGVLQVGSGGIPYFLFVTAGTSIWELFSSVAMWGTRSLELNRGMMARIYFPRIILPVAMGTPALLNFAIHLAVIAIAIAYYRFTLGTLFLNLPGLGWALHGFVLAWVLALAIALWTSVPALVARDVRFTLNYVLGFWVFLTPVIYPVTSLASHRQWLFALNPMTAAVETFKFGMLGPQAGLIDARQITLSWGLTAIVLISGLVFFGRAERTAADRA